MCGSAGELFTVQPKVSEGWGDDTKLRMFLAFQ
jgi:hypothetical protein